MESKDLREYLNHALELESAIYQTSQLKKEYQFKRENAKPKERTFPLPTKPKEPSKRVEYVAFNQAVQKLDVFSKIIWGGSVATTIFCIPFPLIMGIVLGAWVNMQNTMLLIGLVALIPCCVTTGLIIEIKQLELQSIITQNEKDQEKYQADLQAYTKACADIQEKNSTARRTHIQALIVYNQETNVTVNKLSETEATLKSSLYALYSKNVIYTKYRNLVTIATLFEYIDSGRCFELEGPNGAYNLYEGELRSDMIISSLSSIISNLEAIRNNQYTIYQSIENANATTHQLLQNLNNSQMLTAYYANQAAIAASADRYMVGMVW